MAEKDLNLFQFAAIDMAEFCTSSPEIVRSEIVQWNVFSAPSEMATDFTEHNLKKLNLRHTSFEFRSSGAYRFETSRS